MYVMYVNLVICIVQKLNFARWVGDRYNVRHCVKMCGLYIMCATCIYNMWDYVMRKNRM